MGDVASTYRKNDLFISYSIQDLEFAKKLDTAFRSLGRDPWIDLEDLPYRVDRTPEEEWQYIEEGIKEADLFVPIISPDLIHSSRHQQEIKTALEHRKQLVPVLCRQIDGIDVPAGFPDRNSWISLDSNGADPFEPAAMRVIYFHKHDRLRARAREWQRSNRDPDLLLYRSDLESVQEWIGQNQSIRAYFSNLEQTYIEASIQAAEKNKLPRRPDVFVSYSRRDKEFVQRLCSGLKQREIRLWVDWENIPVAAPWRKELEEGISNSDNFLFIMSSDSISSDYCQDEVEKAAGEKHKKRIIPIVFRKDFSSDQAPKVVRSLNWLYFDPTPDFNTFLDKVVKAIKTDEKHVKNHTTLLLQAAEWEAHKRNEELLLHGTKLREAIQWLAQSDTAEGKQKAPQPTPLQREFIQASEKSRDRSRLIRWLATGIGLVGVAGVSFFVIAKTLGEIRALVSSLENKQELDALMVSLKAGRDLQGLGGLLTWFDHSSQAQVVTALQQSIYDLSESNRLERHQGRVLRVKFLGEEGLLASAGEDGNIWLWKQDGTPSQFPLVGHTKEVYAIDYDPIQRHLVSASYDGTIKLWQIFRDANGLPKGRLIRTLSAFSATGLSHEDWIFDVQFSPNGQYIASASRDGTVKVWTSQGELVATLSGGAVYSLAFSRDGRTLATAGRNGVKLWSGRRFSQSRLLPDTRSNFWVSFSPDGRYLVSSGNDKIIKLWRSDGTLIKNLEGHENTVYQAVFSHDSKVLASASADNTVRVWNAETGDWLRTLSGHQDEVYRVKFSPDDRMIASGGADDTVKLWQPKRQLQAKSGDTIQFWTQSADETNDVLLKSLVGHRNAIVDVDFSPDTDTNLLASASDDGTVKLWRTNNRNVMRLRHNQSVATVVFDHQGKFLVSGSVTKLFFWTPDGRAIGLFNNGGEGSITKISLSSNGKLLASAADDGNVRIWKLNLDSEGQLQPPNPTEPPYREPPKQISPNQTRKAIHAVSFSPDNQQLAIGGEGDAIQLWDLTQNSIVTFQPQQGIITSLQFYPSNQQFLAAASKPRTPNSSFNGVMLWRQDGTLIQQVQDFFKQPLGNINSVRFSPDGKLLAAADESNNSIRLWRVIRSANTLSLKPFKTLKGHSGPILELAYSSDRNDYLLASASQDGTVRLWSKDGNAITTFRKHRRDVESVSFSPNGTMLASGSNDRDVLIYSLPTGFSNEAMQVLLDQGCQLAEDYLNVKSGAKPGSGIDEQENLQQIIHNKKFCDAKSER